MAIYNLNSQNKIITAKDITYSPAILLISFVDMLNSNGFEILTKSKEKAINSFTLKKEEKVFIIHFVLRNLTHAGWETKPHIKRIQVQNFSKTNIDLFHKTNENEFFFYVGFYNYDNNPLFVFWDPGRYTNHETNRSCYVFIETLQRAQEIGYIETVNSNRKVWVIKKERFNDFLDNYRSIIK